MRDLGLFRSPLDLTFLSGHVLSFDVEGASEAQLTEMHAHMVVFTKH